jgi:hypothetical protein
VKLAYGDLISLDGILFGEKQVHISEEGSRYGGRYF